MALLKFYPSLKTWLSIIATFAGICLLSSPGAGAEVRFLGILLSIISALSYALYLVIVNRSKRLRGIPEDRLTLYVLIFGSLLFALLRLGQCVRTGCPFVEGLRSFADFGRLLGLALFPTLISLLTLAVSSRYIGPTKTSVLGVFEPITALIIGVMVFSEPFSLRSLLGIVICIASVTFMILRK